MSLIPFMDSLHSDLNTRKQSFCSMCENWTCPALMRPPIDGDEGRPGPEVGGARWEEPWSEQMD